MLPWISDAVIGYNPSLLEDSTYVTPTLTTAQLAQFNTAHVKNTNKHSRHNPDKETPLPIYIALLLHSHTLVIEC